MRNKEVGVEKKEKEMGRREFLKKAGAGVASLFIAGQELLGKTGGKEKKEDPINHENLLEIEESFADSVIRIRKENNFIINSFEKIELKWHKELQRISEIKNGLEEKKKSGKPLTSKERKLLEDSTGHCLALSDKNLFLNALKFEIENTNEIIEAFAKFRKENSDKHFDFKKFIEEWNKKPKKLSYF